MGNFRDDSWARLERFRKRLIGFGVAATFIFVTAETFTHTESRWVMWSFVAALGLVFTVAYDRFYKRIRCPGCDRSVAKVLLAAPDSSRCPHCGADWTTPTTDRQ